MYLKDEHPMRNRIRYVSSHGMRGIGIGPEIVSPEGCVPVLQQSSPPYNGLMTAMTDVYTTLTPVMAPLPNRVDLGHESEDNRMFSILPVEEEQAASSLGGLRGYGRAGSVQQSHAYRGQRQPRRTGEGTSVTLVGFGTCIGC